MKTMALASRLMRDLKDASLAQLTADARLELLDAVNGSLQEMHDLAPPHAKIRNHAFFAAPPQTVAVNVTKGSRDVQGNPFPADAEHCTIRIIGDAVDNQVRGTNGLFHPYAGPTGTAMATIYRDALLVPETIDEVIDDALFIIDSRERIIKDSSRQGEMWVQGRVPGTTKRVAQPRRWWMEAEARSANPAAPAIIRLDTLPDAGYRIQGRVSIAPGRVTFVDMLTDSAVVPIRPQHVESYLLPLCRAKLSTSSMWRDKDMIQTVKNEAESARLAYANLIPQTISTQANRVGTPFGF
jgi:hypothetical protein